jgi:NNMT/PNMT/TEMT family
LPSPGPGPGPGRYDVVLSCYCAESATGDRTVWRRYVRNIVRLLAPGGLFITAALRRCTSYHVGCQRFACADIDEHDLAAVLCDCGIAPAQLQIEVQRVGLRERLGYDSILLAAATCTEPAARPWNSTSPVASVTALPLPQRSWSFPAASHSPCHE